MADVAKLVPHILRWEDLPEVNSERWLSLEDLQGEIWKYIPSYEGIYKVSNYGRVKTLKRNGIVKDLILKIFTYSDGRYYHVKLRNKSIKHVSLHRIVASTFNENIYSKKCVDHINGNTHDNRACNLRWVTHLENSNNPNTVNRKREWGITRINNENRKPVIQYDKSWNEVCRYESIKEAQRQTRISKTGISRAIRGYTYIGKDGIKRTVRTAGGYNWKFAD